MFRIHGTMISVSRDESNTVGNDGNLKGVFRIVFRLGVPHQGPAVNQTKAGKHCEKRKAHPTRETSSPSFLETVF